PRPAGCTTCTDCCRSSLAPFARGDGGPAVQPRLQLAHRNHQQVVQLVQTVVDRFDGELDPLRQSPGFLRAEDRDDAHAAPPALDLNASRSARTSATSARVAAACATCTASSGDTSPGTLRKASTAAASWSIPLIS